MPRASCRPAASRSPPAPCWRTPTTSTGDGWDPTTRRPAARPAPWPTTCAPSAAPTRPDAFCRTSEPTTRRPVDRAAADKPAGYRELVPDRMAPAARSGVAALWACPCQESPAHKVDHSIVKEGDLVRGNQILVTRL